LIEKLVGVMKIYISVFYICFYFSIISIIC
jgi:hypothetical protein